MLDSFRDLDLVHLRKGQRMSPEQISSRDERNTPSHSTALAHGMSLTVSQLQAENDALRLKIEDLEDLLAAHYVDKDMKIFEFEHCELETALRAMELYGKSEQFYFDGTPDAMGQRTERKLRKACMDTVAKGPQESPEAPRET
jgi:hypothetical protein